jgi:tetratricopeptide (TPR) repeat protein
LKNRLTFSNVIGILLDNKKKTYPQHQLVRSLFSLSLDDSEYAEITDADNIKYSNWCNGIRPIPLEIIRAYEDEDNFNFMRDDFSDKIIPNLLNETQARSQMEELIEDSRTVIGNQKADEILMIQALDQFFTEVIRYAILNDHSHSTLYSRDLTGELLSSKVPTATKAFLGRKEELKSALSILQEHTLLFVTGIAGIGKSEFAKTFANKNKKKYTNILFFHYEGCLKKCIAGISFIDDTAEMTEEELFQSHYQTLQKLRSDSLIILDNFNVLPKDDPFFKEFTRNDFQILITTRCKITSFQILEIKELDKENELTALFYQYCPAAKAEPETTSDIINELKGHTLTVCLAALSLSASGMEPEELLFELKSCGLNIHSGEEVEIYKDEEFSEALMIEHLRKLLQLNQLTAEQMDILRNLSLLPNSGVLKNAFKKWLKLGTLNEVNHLVRYGFIMDDEEIKKISLHPLIQDVAMLETMPSVSNCRTLIDSLHLICLTHGLEVRRPENVIQSLISVVERILVDEPEVYLLFLQDMFPYLDKYLVMDYLPKLLERISYTMEKHGLNSICDRALLLDYKAELFVIRKDYGNALKKRLKALELLHSIQLAEMDAKTAALLSNLHNNISNVYLFLKNGKEAAEHLKMALEIRRDYGIFETHDTLQQLMNLTNMLILAKDYDLANQALSLYESIVLENEDDNSFDYAICQMGKGIIALAQNNPEKAELCLLEAEQKITAVMGTDSDYSKSCYRYLHNLYSRWHKRDKALEYQNKFFIHLK